MSKWENISDIIDMSKPASKRDITVGKILTFNYEGSIHSYKVMMLPANGNVWVRPINTLTGDEMNAHYSCEIDATPKAQAEFGGIICLTHGVVIGSLIEPSEFERAKIQDWGKEE